MSNIPEPPKDKRTKEYKEWKENHFEAWKAKENERS